MISYLSELWSGLREGFSNLMCRTMCRNIKNPRHPITPQAQRNNFNGLSRFAHYCIPKIVILIKILSPRFFLSRCEFENYKFKIN